MCQCGVCNCHVNVLDDMLRAGVRLLIKNESHLLGKSSARQNFRDFQLEHASFLNQKTGEPLLKLTREQYINEAFRSLSAENSRMFEGEYSDGWKKCLIEQRTEKSSYLYGDASSWIKFKTFQLESYFKPPNQNNQA